MKNIRIKKILSLNKVRESEIFPDNVHGTIIFKSNKTLSQS